MSELLFEGNLVKLLPLDKRYKSEIFEAIGKKEVWGYTWNDFSIETNFDWMIEDALESKKNGIKIPFIVICKKKNKVAGLTRIECYDEKKKEGEIGGTWFSPEFWKKGFNYEIKYLLLSYLFEQKKANKIQVSISHKNIPSKNSLERIGFKHDYTIEEFKIKNNESHNKVIYKMEKSDWESVKINLIKKLS